MFWEIEKLTYQYIATSFDEPLSKTADTIRSRIVNTIIHLKRNIVKTNVERIYCSRE